MQKSLKGTMLSSHHFCSLGNNHESSDIVTHELEQLTYSSNKTIRKKADKLIKKVEAPVNETQELKKPI
jgi:hypothetical protein